MRVLIALVLALTVVAAVPNDQQRIVGGTITTINNYPEIVALLYSWGTTGHSHACGGTILNNRAILTAAHCVVGDAPVQWRARAGSNNANSGGVTYLTSSIINHPYYNIYNRDYDISILRLSTVISFTANIQPATLSGPNYFLADNQVVWVAGWGTTFYGGAPSENLRHAQIWTVNLNICRARYTEMGYMVTDNMLCAGWLDVGGRDKCQGDFGGPVYHNRVVVGVSSWTVGCAEPRFPGVSTRISRFTPWIAANA